MKTLSLAVAVALSIPVAPSLSYACGMKESYIPSQPAALYVFALDEIENGSFGTALTAARRLVKHGKATKEQKAQGHVVLAWIRKANGLDKQARESLKEARQLDPDSIEAVLGRIKSAEKKVAAELRKEASETAVAVAPES